MTEKEINAAIAEAANVNPNEIDLLQVVTNALLYLGQKGVAPDKLPGLMALYRSEITNDSIALARYECEYTPVARQIAGFYVRNGVLRRDYTTYPLESID